MIANHPIATPASTPTRHDQELVARLESSQVFRDYRGAFETATGLPLVLRAAGSFRPPLAGSRQINAFCALMAARNKSCSACLQLQQRVETEVIGESKTLECFAGLSESVIPIRVGDKIVAYLQTGQVMFRAPSKARFTAALEKLREWNAASDEAELETAYFKTRVLTRSHYEATVRLLASFAMHLSTLSNQLMVSLSHAEPPSIAKARAFIAENLGEPITLGQVARAANISQFYFCKRFKAATGVTFTDYLARSRVERTKQMLLDPHIRVSEAAFAAGFQSLSQFNRLFRRIAGESPSIYRERLNKLEARNGPLWRAA